MAIMRDRSGPDIHELTPWRRRTQVGARAIISILATEIICKPPGRYIGWPTAGRMPDGELLAVFSGDRDAHVDPFGKTFLVRSRDDGQTWDEPELILSLIHI